MSSQHSTRPHVNMAVPALYKGKADARPGRSELKANTKQTTAAVCCEFFLL